MTSNQTRLDEAVRLIRSTTGYAGIAAALAQLASQNRIRIDNNMEDRAQAGLLGTITLGPEAMESSPLSLAQTLVHEYYHLKQNPFEKTVSFWQGVWKRSPVMQRYERPAYQSALRFCKLLSNFIHISRLKHRASKELFARCMQLTSMMSWIKAW